MFWLNPVDVGFGKLGNVLAIIPHLLVNFFFSSKKVQLYGGKILDIFGMQKCLFSQMFLNLFRN